jgi:hypothetical protein
MDRQQVGAAVVWEAAENDDCGVYWFVLARQSETEVRGRDKRRMEQAFATEASAAWLEATA